MKIARRPNDNMTLVPEILHKQNPTAEMKHLPNLGNDSSFAVQFSYSVSKTRAILLFTIKIIIEMFELHARMPPMQSAEYQSTIPLTFLIIIHNYANV